VVSTLQGFSLDDLRAIMRSAAGEGDDYDLDGDIAETPFADLGYDSLALLEVSSQIRQAHAVSVPDGALHGESTPGGTVRLVNELSIP
jgi:minimal PKS acyl carrier protein